MSIQTQHNCKKELQDVALKITPARLGVLAALESATVPLDVASINDYLKLNNIDANPATIFRIVNSFTEKGLALPIQLLDGKLRYEHIANADHHHFICENCGSITDISDCNIDAVQKTIEKKKGLLVKRHSLEFFGLCQDCQK